MAKFLVCLKFFKTINITTKIGTLKNIPDIPQTFPIIDKKISITIGLIFSALPINLLSRKLPTKICVNSNDRKMSNGCKKFKVSILENIEGNTIENNEPI